MRLRLFAAIAVVAFLMTPRAAQAHHSFAAEFDINKPVTLQGVLTKMEWVNPHGWIYVDVKTPDGQIQHWSIEASIGQIQHWSIEAGGPTQLLRRGLRKDDFPAGIEVTITGYRSRDGSFTANGQSVKLKDGRNFFMGSATTPGAEAADAPR